MRLHSWSDHMLISILSVSVELLEMPCAEAADAVAPLAASPRSLIYPESSSVALSFLLEADQTWSVRVWHSKSFGFNF